MKPWDIPLDAASLGWLDKVWGRDIQSGGLILQGLLERCGDKALRAAQRPPRPPNRQLGIGTELISGEAGEPPVGLHHAHRWALPQPPFPNAPLGFSCLIWSVPALEPSQLWGWPPALPLPKPAPSPPAGLKGHLREAFSDHQGNTAPHPTFIIPLYAGFLSCRVFLNTLGSSLLSSLFLRCLTPPL